MNAEQVSGVYLKLGTGKFKIHFLEAIVPVAARISFVGIFEN
jgi:hypothetical protein